MRRRAPYADPGVPDTRGPGRYLVWLVVSQLRRALAGTMWSTIWMVGMMLPPYLLSRAVDDGLRAGDMSALVWWTVGILALTLANALAGMARHRTMTFLRTDASLRTVQVVTRQTTRLGHTLSRRVGTGEVVTIGATDVSHIALALTCVGPGVGAVMAYGAVTVLLLAISPVLATVVLLGVPLLGVVIGPLLGRLQTAETRYREHQGALTAQAGDIVAGLRVLCGIGGKEQFARRYRSASQDLRAEGYRVGAVTSWIQAVAAGMPTLFLVAVTWIAARMASAGQITVGEMIAVYGYVAALIVPVLFLIEGADQIAKGLVAARRVVNVLRLAPIVQDHVEPVPGPDQPAALHDPASGVTIAPGVVTALVTARTVEATAILERLARHVDSDAVWGDTPLARLPLAETRRRILLAADDAYLFAGTLREALATGEDHADAAVLAALHTAAADDVLSGLPHGLDSTIRPQGRDLSGGQRQRLRLARSVLADPDVLLLIEPTSSVDAHTEAVIARRLSVARTGRTTVVVTASPLVLDHADHIVLLVDGRVHTEGTHAALMTASRGYRALVTRDVLAEDEAADPAPARPTRADPVLSAATARSDTAPAEEGLR
ncbi:MULTISPECIES: ABC transporter ATP-binding protein [Actinoalloteichus]|uniref:ABC-type multidrug transport system, ATPase and permease component n=1 Tax=Actinoalloteichus fjordicus TaxID=1612552 RepID=A0AAC9LF12_9PSEU|nr:MULTISPECIES: ABC transporter ATP-binding protein [Actinoalloteichus]APU15029.1 ABC-type multidrug transport system, ATPase and permease component [Actinoalloteichus fjordicus]APU21097.1 ABC-type multidrug transport system, ATPase and permease component [Actinoalloteichus sp. GBA129-24]